MPPWFAEMLRTCEHLSLDNEVDREELWLRVRAYLPHEDIEQAIARKHMGVSAHGAARIRSTVMDVLEGIDVKR